jgi:hypothetical protein
MKRCRRARRPGLHASTRRDHTILDRQRSGLIEEPNLYRFIVMLKNILEASTIETESSLNYWVNGKSDMSELNIRR